MNNLIKIPAFKNIISVLSIACYFLLSGAAYAVGTLSISSLVPGNTVYVGSAVTFTATPTGFTNPTYTVEDNFGGTSVSNASLNSSGNFTWTPSMGDIGTHAIVITAVDSLGNAANVTQYISVSNPSVTLSSPTPSATVDAGVRVTFTTTAVGFSTPTYTANDSFIGGTVSSGSVDAAGVFSWTPLAQDVGNHTIGITVSDSFGRSITVTKLITVPAVTPLTMTIQSLPVGAVASPNQTMTFTASVVGATTLTYTVTDAFYPTTITAGNINSSGVFTWTPTVDEMGAHRITVYATDSLGRTASSQVTITVQTSIATIQSLSPGSSIYFGKSVAFNVVTTGFNNPTYALSDTFPGTSITSTNIDATGHFAWTPKIGDVGTHTISVNTSDTGGHNASTSQVIVVTAGPVMTLQSFSPSHVISSGSLITFSASTSGMSTSTFAIIDTFAGSSLTNANINTLGNVSWTPKVSDVGIHQVAVYATELSGRSVSTSTTITVLLGSSPIPATSTQVGQIPLAKYYFLTNLFLGSSGVDVTALQNFLVQSGYLTATPNGYFGYQTQSAVKKFQIAKGISAVGSVGPQTRATLNQTSLQTTSSITTTSSGYKFLNPLYVGMSGNDVSELQKILINKGFLIASATGYFGPLTEAAVKKFQATNGLEQLGNVGPGTRSALNSGL